MVSLLLDFPNCALEPATVEQLALFLLCQSTSSSCLRSEDCMDGRCHGKRNYQLVARRLLLAEYSQVLSCSSVIPCPGLFASGIY